MKHELDERKHIEERIRIVINFSSDFLADYNFHFSSIGFDEAIHLSYFINPPMSRKPEGERNDFFISAEVSDDIGNEYMFLGGAHGLSPSAPCTNGTLSFSPLPKEGAVSLEFIITVLKGDVEVQEKFTVPLEGYWKVTS